MDAMKSKGLALFFSNDIYPTSADGTLPFKQAADVFYLSGVDQEDTILLLFPDAHDPNDREILFSLETSEELAIWHGAKLTKAEAVEQTGVKNVQWLGNFDSTLHRLMAEAEVLYLNDNQHTRANSPVETREM
ncbi:MAG: X-Pro aminopeptidase, partial [Euryarchaeota archaeon]|nr:X-Pro aminopeptidase [Euryarchaeota archaeon]